MMGLSIEILAHSSAGDASVPSVALGIALPV